MNNSLLALPDIWSALTDQGFALTSVQKLGLPEKICENFAQTYFTADLLRHDEDDLPVDRQRARDVIRYYWNSGTLSLEEFNKITIKDRAGISGEREHSRIKVLEDPQADELVRTLLHLVPPGRRKPDGTFGVNLFRTFTNVVTKPHHDDEEYIILYVLNRIGSGAESYLYRPEDVLDTGELVGKPTFWRQLNPGEILIIEDKRFMHGATPLVPPPGAVAMRDALVCTVDHRKTYLGQEGESPGLIDRLASV